jgi:hypothetical protein
MGERHLAARHLAFARERITSSIVMRFWNWAFGLRAPYSAPCRRSWQDAARSRRSRAYSVAPAWRRPQASRCRDFTISWRGKTVHHRE